MQAPSTAPSGHVGEQPPTFKDATYATVPSYPVCDSESGTSPTTVDDLRRELQIQQRGRDIERYRLLSSTTPDLSVMWEAMARMNVAKREMYELISQRSPEQRARMQAAQDTRMAAEPGATR